MFMRNLNLRLLKNNIIEKIETGGSTREFYRCKYRNKIAILVIDPDIKKYLRVHKHLLNGHINVPRLYWTDKAKAALLEDLGTISLYVIFRKQPELFYHRKAIDMLVSMQKKCSSKFPIAERYDRPHIKWEQKYFKKYFLFQYGKVEQTAIDKTKDEFAELTDQVLRSIQDHDGFFMHRDFQSQNIFVKNNKIRIIDFQSARIGPLTYDLSSLLRDPYADLTISQERQLLDHYFKKIKPQKIPLSYDQLIAMYRLTCIQRNMQALGAYANLALNKGKKHFLKYIPRGRQLLMQGLKECNFERLLEIVQR